MADYAMRLSIYEGKYHQVKRMIAAVDNRVVALHREKIGQLNLDDNVAPGEYRSLTPEEVDTIFN
jgi:16S rRNA pseudouridine516 synthase